MKETLEEYIDEKQYNGDITEDIAEAIRIGAKWQQETMYSEEDMREAILFGVNGMYAGVNGMYGYEICEKGYVDNQIKIFLEQFKNK